MITAEEWEKVEKELDSIFGRVELQCDEFNVTIGYARGKKPTDWRLMVYVDGTVKGKWFCHYGEESEPEEAKRFYPIKSRFTYTRKARTAYAKASRKEKKWLAETGCNPNEKHTYRDFDWKSVKSLIKHLVANNKEIKLLKLGYKEYVNENNPESV